MPARSPAGCGSSAYCAANVSTSTVACVIFHRRKSGGFSKRNSDAVAFRKRSKPPAIARVRGFGHDLPTIAQHARNVLIHCLHAWQQPLPVVFPRPISLVRKRFHSHLRHRGYFPAHALSKAIGWHECPQIAPCIVGEQIAKRKQSCATARDRLVELARQDSRDSGGNSRVYPLCVTEVVHIGKAAKLGGVSVDTIRFYQKLGLVKSASRSTGGYRL